ncbi:permease prefix domain 1-containing protein [Paraclostridium bifermentans]|uniref:Permease prefix domain 1-containing protein n=1 Tax=Paraclostridium bifermentans TaxID=1490 RepID=A0ABY8R654_PARBF|nr:permease prefix domain 1-containing protein [Paraclostridium bifermentans]
MKIIDEYLKSLYKNDKSKEVKELKEELREHLITSTNEFIDNGYSEEDAQREAINQFDGGTEMLKDLHKSLKESKKDNEKLNKRMINIFKIQLY